MNNNARTYILSHCQEEISQVWTLDASGLLLVNGTGKIPDCSCEYAPEPAPWEQVKDRITAIRIGEGITEIGLNAFRDCPNLREVIIPPTCRRIHGNAFRDCGSLISVKAPGRRWRYIYEESVEREKNLTFGVDTFRNVPWARKHFGNFYVKMGQLYTCFHCEEKMIIPEGVQVLKSLSLAHIAVNKIVLPQSLQEIEDLAFSGSRIKSTLSLPNGLKKAKENAFRHLKVEKISFPHTWKKLECRRERTRCRTKGKVPGMIPLYSVCGQSIPGLCSEYCFLFVRKNKPVFHRDGTITQVSEDPGVNIAQAIRRRLRGRSVVCIRARNKVVTDFRIYTDYGSSVWGKRIEEDIWQPMIDCQGEYDYQHMGCRKWSYETFADRFPEVDGALSVRSGGRLTLPDDGTEEFWFSQKTIWPDMDPYDFCIRWIQAHPDYRV